MRIPVRDMITVVISQLPVILIQKRYDAYSTIPISTDLPRNLSIGTRFRVALLMG